MCFLFHTFKNVFIFEGKLDLLTCLFCERRLSRFKTFYFYLREKDVFFTFLNSGFERTEQLRLRFASGEMWVGVDVSSSHVCVCVCVCVQYSG